ncbi:MAG: hypothetical protein OXG97_02950, partial [Candidatus Poribacteria bacterium]|nr:hypothetical protein [Candidatus Poribacteria bacterium]
MLHFLWTKRGNGKGYQRILEIGKFIIRISRSHLYQGPDWHGRIASKRRYFYGLKVHLMVTETGKIVEAFFTPGRCSDVLGLRCYDFDLPQGSVVYADKA